jgi:hypothetical protein
MSYAHIAIVQIIAGSKTLAPLMNQNYAIIVDRVNALSDSANSADTSIAANTALLSNVAGREQQIADQLGGTTTGVDPNKVLAFTPGNPSNLVVGRTAYWYYEFAVDLNYPQPTYQCDAARSTVPSLCGYINMGGVPTNSTGQIKLQQKIGGAGAWVDVAGYVWNLLNSDPVEVLAPFSPVPAVKTFTAGTLLRTVVVSGSTGAVLPHYITLVLAMTEAARNQ